MTDTTVAAPEFALHAVADWTPAGTPIASRRGVVLAQRVISGMLPLIASLVAAALLVLRYDSIVPDAQSRLANAYYVFFSRDPHLSAVGFVWNPLPSVVDMPLVLLKGVWPALTTKAFGANVMSSVFYAAAAYQLYRFLEDLRLGTVARWGLWLCFAANPLVFYYGANGMSESLFLFTLIVCARYLTRWLVGGQLGSLVAAGTALGFAYLARDEAVAVAIVATFLVAWHTYRLTDDSRDGRIRAGLLDASIFVAPFALAFVFLALTSWVIVGHPFEQFSSTYGNASQVAHAAAGSIPGHTALARLGISLKAVLSLAPLILLIIVVTIYRAWRIRDPRVFGALSVLGAVLVFEIVSFSLHQTFLWYRYYIYAVPLVVLTAACLAAPERNPEAGPVILVGGGKLLVVPARSAAMAMGAIVLALTLPGLITTSHTLGTAGDLTNADRAQLSYILWPGTNDARVATSRRSYLGVERFAGTIDGLDLSRGAVMVDDFTGCVPQLILDSKDPREFLIPSDEDYQEKMGSPYQFGVRYFLVPNPATNPVDALNREYPSLFASGQGLASLVRDIRIPGCPELRLYKLIPRTA